MQEEVKIPLLCAEYHRIMECYAVVYNAIHDTDIAPENVTAEMRSIVDALQYAQIRELKNK